LEKALRGERQLVFVTGEPGIGKTTLVDTFLQTLKASCPTLDRNLWVGRGQCIAQCGAGEAYMPILEALGRLCREPAGEQLRVLLHQYAPTWLVQMLPLLNPTELEALQCKVQGSTRERMLREMVEVLDVITAERPLVLWLEDLHWSDVSTLELLALLARRREPARLLILGTYRPVDVIVNAHPLRAMKQELQLHRQCHELAVRWLREEEVAEYLTLRFAAERGGGRDVPLQQLSHTIHQRTEGNPLFMVNVVNELLAQGMIDHTALALRTPATIRELIERHLDQLSAEDQTVIEVASVAGVEFSAAAVAAGLAAAIETVEASCAALARRGQFLQTKGVAEWPDGTIATRYGFLHELYQEVTYRRVPVGRRAYLHQRIGARIEVAYGTQVSQIAAELAVHFDRGHEQRRAVHYHEQAGQNATRRSAHQEAKMHFTRGLTLVKALPDTPDRAEQELTLQMALGASLQATQGYATPEAERAYTRARQLCQQVAKTPQLFWVLRGLSAVSVLRAELRTAIELGQQLLALAQKAGDPTLLVEAHTVLGGVLVFRGELTSARAHAEQALALQALQQDGAPTAPYGQDPGVFCRIVMALALWAQGYADQALGRIHEALTLSRDLPHSVSHAEAVFFAALLHHLRREGHAAWTQAEAVIALARSLTLPFFEAWGMILGGAVLAERGRGQEGMERIRQGLSAFQATGAKLHRPYQLALLTATQGSEGQAEEGLLHGAEALTQVHEAEERYFEAELYRLRGELTLQKEARGWIPETGPTSPQALSIKPQVSGEVTREAEGYFQKAIEIARQQQAKSWELRATMSLVRLRQQAVQAATRTTQHETHGRLVEAHKLLADIYGWFTEGFDTKNLQEAKTLLDELRR
jgi:predicted ATPase/type II secretory pathway predicted ATPase ExeA